MPDSLKDLIVDETTVAEDQLATALAPYVRFTSSGELILEESFEGLSADQQLYCLLLALQALKLLGLRETDEASPAEIVAISHMAPGTVRSRLSQLAKKRLVSGRDGKYSLPMHSARRAMAQLGKGTS